MRLFKLEPIYYRSLNTTDVYFNLDELVSEFIYHELTIIRLLTIFKGMGLKGVIYHESLN